MVAIAHFVILYCIFIIGGVLCDLDPAPNFPAPGEYETGLVYFFRPESVLEISDPFIADIESIALAYNIPDINQTVKASIGNIQISLTNIIIDRFNLGDFSVKTNPSSVSLDGNIADSIFSMRFDYALQELSFPYKSESGSGTVSTDNLTMTASVSTYRAPDTGSIQVVINYFTFDIGDFVIDMEGGLVANIVKTLEGLFSDVVNDLLSTTITQFILDIIQPNIDNLLNHGLYYCEEDDYCIDLRMTKDPGVSSVGVYVYLNGTFYDGLQQDKLPEVSYDEIDEVSTDKLLQLQIGNSVLLSMFEVIQLEGGFSLKSPARIPYDSIVEHFPAWAEAYPEGTDGELSITSSAAPTSEIMYSGLRIISEVLATITPVDQEDATGLSANISTTMIGDLWWKEYHHSDNDIVKHPEDLSIEVSLVSASSDSEALGKEWATELLDSYYVPALNDMFYEHPLRIFTFPGLQYTNQKISYNGEYVLLTADFVIVE